MTSGPRNEEEAAMVARFDKACAAFRKAFGRDVEMLLVARRKDGVLLSSNGCCHSAFDLACAVAEILHDAVDENDREQSKRN